MELDLKTLQLDQSDINSMHDVLIEILDSEVDLTDEEVNNYFKMLPEHLKLDAYTYGISDTVVRDDIYVYLKDKI